MAGFVHYLQVRKSMPSQKVDWKRCPNTSCTQMANIRRHGRGVDGSVLGRRIGVYPWRHRLAGVGGRPVFVGSGSAPWRCVGRSLVPRRQRSEVGRGRRRGRCRGLGRPRDPGSANCQSKDQWRLGLGDESAGGADQRRLDQVTKVTHTVALRFA